MSVRFPEVSNLNYRDLSDSQSGQLIRQLNQLRVDMKNSSQDIIEGLKQASGGDSPYVKDRKHLDPNRVYNSPTENNWKNIPTYDSERNVSLNIKKLDVLY